MKIGFYFDCFKKSGGVYQIALNHLEALSKIKNHSFWVFNISPDFPYKEYENKPNWKIVDLVKFSERKQGKNGQGQPSVKVDKRLKRKIVLFGLDIIRFFHLYRLENFLTRIKARKRAKIFEHYGMDLILFPGTSELSLFTKVPSVVIIHDAHHRLTPEFPEMSKKGQWSKREYVFKRIDRNAFRIYVDSEVGKADVIRLYGVKPEKISILRPLPPPYINTSVTPDEIRAVQKKYSLPDKFLFYPAQFWPHKNHRNLVEAIAMLKEKKIIVPLVLVGSQKELWGEYDRILDLIKKHGLQNQIKILGFVPVEEISPLYKLATGLIMPMFVGWTYVPIVEAWALDCPIIYTTAHGCPEQGSDSAIYVDPHSPEDISIKIKEFWQNPSLRQKLVINGRKKLASWTRDDFDSTIKATIDDFQKEKTKHTG